MRVIYCSFITYNTKETKKKCLGSQILNGEKHIGNLLNKHTVGQASLIIWVPCDGEDLGDGGGELTGSVGEGGGDGHRVGHGVQNPTNQMSLLGLTNVSSR